MSWFNFGSNVSDVKSNLQEIKSLSIQNRIDGDRELKDVTQYAKVINNYFSETPKKDVPLKKEEESYYGEFGVDEDDITNMTDEDWAKYGSHDNWISGTISKEYFNATPELVAVHGTLKNYEKGVTIEHKAKKSFFGLTSSIKKEIKLANNARAMLREEDIRIRTEQAERFKRKTEDNMRKEAERIQKATDATNRSKSMMDMARKEREENTRLHEEKNSNLLNDIKSLMAGMAQPKQLSEKAIVDNVVAELMARVNRPQDGYIEARVLTR